MNENDVGMLRKAIAVAASARAHGNHPFGATLVDAAGNVVLSAENTVNTDHDCTGHAEMNLIRKASRQFSREEMADTTLYSSTEPCPMCSGAIYWSGVRRVAYALSAARLYELTTSASGRNLPHSRAILDVGGIEVEGPAIEDEALQVHVGFWHAPERE